jgi:hydroxymethylpyrimidine/phosphomethylpyrimidine kinase
MAANIVTAHVIDKQLECRLGKHLHTLGNQTSKMKKPPIVMTFSGHDPSGGAGIQADIESLVSLGCQAVPVITTLTIQDTSDVHAFTPLGAAQVTAQARTVLDDMPVAAFKIGMLGSAENAQAIDAILQDYPDLPLVLDPVLASGGGTELGTDDLLDVMRSLLVSHTTVLTPNSLEARALAPQAKSLDDCALALLEQGAEYVLITGTHEDSPQVVNRLYHEQQLLESFTWERLPHSYHGSGCTLAASIAGLLALGLEPFQAINEAQDFTWNALRQGHRPGQGQYLPDRLFWSKD